MTRHERLSHDKNAESAQPPEQTQHQQNDPWPNKRVRASFDQNEIGQALGQPQTDPDNSDHLRNASYPTNYSNGHLQPSRYEFGDPLAALSLAAEQSAFRDATAASVNPMPVVGIAPMGGNTPTQTPAMEAFAGALPGSDTGVMSDTGFTASLDDFAAYLENEPLSSYSFSSLMMADQPLPFFSPDSLVNSSDNAAPAYERLPGIDRLERSDNEDEANLFSRFGSRLPSLQPEERASKANLQSSPRPNREISAEDRETIATELAAFSNVVPGEFQLPSRLAMSRYVAAYINCFHEHLPFLHIPTLSVDGCCVELILAMAAVGTQYCFEAEKGVLMFQVARAVARERIKRRDAKFAFHRRESGLEVLQGATAVGSEQTPVGGQQTPEPNRGVSGPLGLPSSCASQCGGLDGADDLMQTAQALLILMAMATWAKHREILREALAIQSVLATLVRDDGLQEPVFNEDMSWEDWARIESMRRTKFIVFCFFNLHCIVYNIPPLILNSELKLRMPCSAAEFRADNAGTWRDVRVRASTSTGFEEAIRKLFARGGRDVTERNSALANYVLIHAIIQQIFFLRQTARCRFDNPGELTVDDVTSLERALRNWQLGWNRNPESTMNALDVRGPVAFNSTALLRLAYIRLNLDTGPCRALDTRDPVQIASALRDSPVIKRTPKLVRAVLHSAHALSIPVKIGIQLVARTQQFLWSIQHSLCTLECAFLLSKWLQAASLPNAEPPVSDDERRIMSLVQTMLDETEFALPSGMSPESADFSKHLNAGVLRVWATIFRGGQTWAIVEVIGRALNIYADLLEAS